MFLLILVSISVAICMHPIEVIYQRAVQFVAIGIARYDNKTCLIWRKKDVIAESDSVRYYSKIAINLDVAFSFVHTATRPKYGKTDFRLLRIQGSLNSFKLLRIQGHAFSCSDTLLQISCSDNDPNKPLSLPKRDPTLLGLQVNLRFSMWDFKFSRRRVLFSELYSGLYCRVEWLSTIILHGSITQKTALNTF
jgi:hypothetical protein